MAKKFKYFVAKKFWNDVLSTYVFVFSNLLMCFGRKMAQNEASWWRVKKVEIPLWECMVSRGPWLSFGAEAPSKYLSKENYIFQVFYIFPAYFGYFEHILRAKRAKKKFWHYFAILNFFWICSNVQANVKITWQKKI